MLILHCSGSNSLLLIHLLKIYQFKAKYSEIKAYPLCLRSIMRDFSINNMKKKKTRLDGYVNAFSVDYNIFDTDNIHKHFMRVSL